MGFCAVQRALICVGFFYMKTQQYLPNISRFLLFPWATVRGTLSINEMAFGAI